MGDDAKIDVEAEKKKAVEQFREWVRQKTTPGEHPLTADGRPKQLSDLRPCGQCDGVIYFGSRDIFDLVKDQPVRIAVRESKEREALRYLRPMPDDWRAERLSKVIGVSMPHDIEGFLFSDEMLQQAREAGVALKWLFTCDDHCIDAVQQKHCGRWKVFPVEPGVWAVLYV